MLHAKIINKNFVNKSDISGFINSTDLNEKRKTKKISSKCIVKSRAIQNRKNTNDLSLIFIQCWFINDRTTKCLNTLTKYKHFQNVNWPYKNNCSMAT